MSERVRCGVKVRKLLVRKWVRLAYITIKLLLLVAIRICGSESHRYIYPALFLPTLINAPIFLPLYFSTQKTYEAHPIHHSSLINHNSSLSNAPNNQ